MTDSTTKPEREGPIQWTDGSGSWFKLFTRTWTERDQRRTDPVAATSVDLAAALQANPQLRAAVLEWLGECMRWSIAEERMAAVITKLRLAEAELAAERARVRELKEQRHELRNAAGNLVEAMKVSGSQPPPTVFKAFQQVELALRSSQQPAPPPAEQATDDGTRAIEAILDANCLREIRQLVDGGDVDPRGVVFSIRTSLAARYRWTGPAAPPAEQAKGSAPSVPQLEAKLEAAEAELPHLREAAELLEWVALECRIEGTPEVHRAVGEWQERNVTRDKVRPSTAARSGSVGGEAKDPMVVMVTDTLRRVVGEQEAQRHKFTMRRDDGGLSCSACGMPESYRLPCSPALARLTGLARWVESKP